MAAASHLVSITYVPAGCGSVIPGKSKAPEAFRDADIVSKLQAAGIPSVLENSPLDEPARYAVASFDPGRIRNQELNISVCERVYNAIEQNLASSHHRPPFQLILGGEAGMYSPQKRVGLIFIDADTDLNSPTDPDSTGIFAGMNMTHLTGAPGALESMEKKFSRPSGDAVCDASNTVLFGTNMACATNKPEHFGYLLDRHYRVISSTSVARAPETRAREALAYLEGSVDVIMVHLDVDSIDPSGFPLANVPNFTGVGFDEMMAALRVLLRSGKVVGLTIAEVNPDHDPGRKMIRRLTDSVVSMLADRIRVQEG
ncbi:hypothetical protein F4778DRAFT_772147 [Xylariomycetidae sp. FL2044]|nr:hypothetical protein F4778DRAFT_772147 [Xylariomycetidae sp. FL2044]